MNPTHESNRRHWDAASGPWQQGIDESVDWRRCPLDPAIALAEQELAHLGDLSGKRACALGSGDNLVLLAPGPTAAFDDDRGIDFVATGTAVTPASFGVLADGVIGELGDHDGQQ